MKQGLKWAGILLLVLVLGGGLWVAYQLRFLFQKPQFDTALPPDPGEVGLRGVLLFSKTNGYRHASIEAGLRAISQLGRDRDWTVIRTENAAFFRPEYLARFRVVVFLCTTGDLFTEEQKLHFQQFIENGGGYVGIHSASDTEHGWDWYAEMLGGEFKHHTLFPQTPTCPLLLEDPQHPASVFLPEVWERADEWYSFTRNPREQPGVHVLYSLDEASCDMGAMGGMGDHPIAWVRQQGQGNVFYTAIGHTPETFDDPIALQHLASAIAWAGKF
jgi:hypothetical protein